LKESLQLNLDGEKVGKKHETGPSLQDRNQEDSAGDKVDDEVREAAPEKNTPNLLGEIVLSMSVLMFGAIVLITILVYFLQGYWPPEYVHRYAVIIIIPYILIFALTVGVFGWWVLKKQVLEPLHSLLEATEKVAGGDFEHRVDITRNREMKSLGLAFNNMTRRLAANHRELEDNVVELKRVNENLEKTQWELLATEKLASIGRLAAGVAHEIGNPLASINGYMQIMQRREYLETKDREILDRVQKEIHRMDDIINELLDYSRPQDQVFALTDLNEILDSSLTLLTAQKGFDKVDLSVDKGEIPLVDVNRNSVQQLIMNLVLNAVQAMEEGGKLNLETRKNKRDESEGVELVVSDTGPGIAEENLEKVFDPFFTTKEPGQGTGLGLSICLRIAENNHGKLSAENGPDKGAVFRLWLPASKSED